MLKLYVLSQIKDVILIFQRLGVASVNMFLVIFSMINCLRVGLEEMDWPTRSSDYRYMNFYLLGGMVKSITNGLGTLKILGNEC